MVAEKHQLRKMLITFGIIPKYALPSLKEQQDTHRTELFFVDLNGMVQVIIDREKAYRLLNSEKGIEKRKQRCPDVEPVFGNIKQNHGFRRFMLRGKEKWQ